MKVMSGEYGCNTEARDVKIVVSLTTTVARIGDVSVALSPIFEQTVKPDRVLLWLGVEQFPQDEKQLPEELLGLRQRGLEIMWGNDLGPHTKYYHAFKSCPDDIVITIDDDVFYPHDLIERLYKSYQRFPDCISAMRAHLMTFAPDGELNPYDKWEYECEALIDVPRMDLFATGVGGVLYPPGVMPKETLNREAFSKLCFFADDVWLKFMQVLANVPVVVPCGCFKLEFVGETQKTALFKVNVKQNRNDTCIGNVLSAYNVLPTNGETLLGRIITSSQSAYEGASPLIKIEEALMKERTKIVELRGCMVEMQSEHERLNAELRAKITELRGAVVRLRSDRDRLKAEHERDMAKIEELRSAVVGLRETRDRLKAELAEARNCRGA